LVAVLSMNSLQPCGCHLVAFASAVATRQKFLVRDSPNVRGLMNIAPSLLGFV
jgi:hypothetical protein